MLELLTFASDFTTFCSSNLSAIVPHVTCSTKCGFCDNTGKSLWAKGKNWLLLKTEVRFLIKEF